MNAINKAGLRANAEGWSIFKVFPALAYQIQKDLEEAREKWEAEGVCEEPVEEKEVVDLLTSIQYTGGYMYPISVATPSTFQGYMHSRDGSSDPDVEGAQKWVQDAPVGTEVRYQFRKEQLEEEQIFLKTSQGWDRIFYKDYSMSPNEDSGPWLTSGVRERVAKVVGAPLSSTFHQSFDDAVEKYCNPW